MLALTPANTLRMKRKNNKITIIMMIKKRKSKKIISILLYRRQCAAEHHCSALLHCASISFMSHTHIVHGMVIYLAPKSHAKLCLSSFFFVAVVVVNGRRRTDKNNERKNSNRISFHTRYFILIWFSMRVHFEI